MTTQTTGGNVNLDIQSIPAGIYIINVRHGEITAHEKLVKQ
jgi:hypothetical protein